MKEKVGWDPFRSIYSSWEVNTGWTVAALLLSSVAFGVCVYIAYRRRKGEIDEAGTRHLAHEQTLCATESTTQAGPQSAQQSESSTNTSSIVPPPQPSRKLLIRPKRVTNVNALPLEIQLQILSLLSTRELCMMGQVNRFYCQLCQDNSLWKALCRQQSTYIKSIHPDGERRNTGKDTINKIRKKLKIKSGEAGDIEMSSVARPNGNEDTLPPLDGSSKDYNTPPLGHSNTEDEEGSENWKEKTAEGFKVRRNWVHGEYADLKLQGHIASVYDIQFYDNTLVSCSADGLVKVWDMLSCECLVSVDKHNTGVNTISWQNSCVVSGSPADGAIHIWDLQTIKRNISEENEKNADSNEEAADASNEVLSSSDGSTMKKPYVRDYDLYLFHCSVLNHPGVYCAELLPNENGITKLHREIQGDEEGQDIEVEGLLLATGSTSDSDIRVWNLATETCLTTLQGHRFGLCCLKFERDKIVSGSEDKTVRVWDYAEERERCRLMGHTNWVRALCCEGNTIYSGSADRTVRQWDLRSRTSVLTLNQHECVRALQMDSTKLVVTHWDGITIAYDLRTLKPFEPLKYQNIVYCMQFDETRLVTGSHDATVQIWDFENVDLSLYRW